MNNNSFSELNNNNNQYKNTKNELLNKFMYNSSQNIKNINNNDEKSKLYFKKNYNTNDFIQFKDDIINNDNYKKEDGYKYRITRVNIDSKNRNIIPKNILSSQNIYKNNPFTFKQNDNNIYINYIDHGYTNNDKIIISNVNGNEYNLSSFEFINNSKIMGLCYLH